MITERDVPGGAKMNVFERLREVKGIVSDVYPSMSLDMLKDYFNF